MKCFLGLLLFFSVASLCKDPEAYNEMLQSNGDVRVPYQEFLQENPEYRIFPTERDVQVFMNNPLGDKIKILPMPLVLSEEDHEKIRLGAKQRAEAFRLFWIDAIMGEGQIFNEPLLMSKRQLEAIFLSYSSVSLSEVREMWRGVPESEVRFIYGPDVVRAQDGTFRVLEDNIGLVGGLADVDAIHEVFEKQLSGIRSDSSSGYTAYEQFVKSFLGLGGTHADSILTDQDYVLNGQLSYAKRPLKASDNENMRLSSIQDRTLTFGRVINLVVNDEAKIARMIDWLFETLEKNPQTSDRVFVVVPFALYLANLRKSQHETYMQAIKSGKLKFLASPDLDILSSKAFLPFVDNMIRFYLNEEPILVTQPTKWVDPTSYDFQMRLRNPDLMQDSVLKGVNGAQGSEVFVIRSLPNNVLEDLINVMNKLSKSSNLASFNSDEPPLIPEYIEQEYLDVSFLPTAPQGSWFNFNVDMRPILYVNGRDILVHDKIWGRAAPKIPGVLNNVSQTAYELIVTKSSVGSECLRYFAHL